MHVIAAEEVAFKEPLQPALEDWRRRVVVNAGAMAEVLVARGCELVPAGTDDHLFLNDSACRTALDRIELGPIERRTGSGTDSGLV